MLAPGHPIPLEHPCLSDPRPSAPLGEAALSGRERVAVLLEGCALDAHLARVGLCPSAGWQGARVSPRGRLVAVGVSAVSSACPSAAGAPGGGGRERALALLRRLFGSDDLVGRGEGRRVARGLLRRWSLYLTAVGSDDLVADVLDAAPFLWGERFAGHRESLAARLRRGGEERLEVAGRPSFRRQALCRATTLRALVDLVRGGEARMLWLGEPAQEVCEVFPAAWPPRGGVRSGRGAVTRGPALARIEEASRQGRWRAAAREAERLRRSGAAAGAEIHLARLAIEACLYLGRWRRAAAWAAWAGGVVAAGDRDRARLLAAWVAHESADAAASFAPVAPGPDLDSLLAWARVESERDPEAVTERLSRVLRHRGGDRAGERGRLWLELGRARLARGDGSAERAFVHALGHARRGDRPLDLWLAAAGVAGARVRRGALEGIDAVIAELAEQAAMMDDRRRQSMAAMLGLRLELARGRAERVVAAAAAIRAQSTAGHHDASAGAIEVLEARALGWLGRRDEAALRIEAVRASALTTLDPEERPAVWALAGLTERALAAAAELGVAAGWRRLLVEGVFDPAELGSPDAGFRCARLVIDAALLGARASEQRRRAAAEELARCGAAELASLAPASPEPWGAARRFLSEPSAGRVEIARLFRDAGYGRVRLSLVAEDGAVERLIDGAGGEAELSAATAAGRRLVLCCAEPVGDDLRGLLALARERLSASMTAILPVRGPAAPAVAGNDRGAIVGRSRALAEALRRIDRLARGDVAVLLCGETGTGKELAAKRLHRGSPRRDRPFLAVNCAALSESLLLSELFGHARGAFTGADRDHAGVFEAAQGGVVFLDEIGDLPLAAQGALLRVLQEGEVRRVGEAKPRRVDVRVVAATHRDLAALIARGSFRQDLYYRLSVAVVRLPPLRERGEDVLILARHFLAEHGASLRLARDAEDHLLACTWPGNVRELWSVVQVAATLHDGGGTLCAADLGLPAAARPGASYHRALDAERRRLLEEALAAGNGQRAAAARRLGITPQAVSYLVRRLGLTRHGLS